MGQRNGRAQGLRPKGYPAAREVGNISLPTKLLEKGVKDMVRITSGSVVTRESH